MDYGRDALFVCSRHTAQPVTWWFCRQLRHHCTSFSQLGHVLGGFIRSASNIRQGW